MNVSGKLGPYHTASPEIERVLDTAIITAPDKRDPKLMRKLDAVAGRILKQKKKAKRHGRT
jgi:5'-methylthioadenosine phosphorylase